MIRWLAPVLLLAAGCASTPREDRALLTLVGDRVRLESWNARVVERGHVHAGLQADPCPLSLVQGLTDTMKTGLAERHPEAVEKSSRAMVGLAESLCNEQHGKAYGGADRIVLVLRYFAPDQETADEAVILDCPRLKPDENERRFQAGEFIAVRERPIRTVDATLERGWVRIIRLAPTRYEFELFLVLKSDRKAAGEDRIQVITRVDATTR